MSRRRLNLITQVVLRRMIYLNKQQITCLPTSRARLSKELICQFLNVLLVVVEFFYSHLENGEAAFFQLKSHLPL